VDWVDQAVSRQKAIEQPDEKNDGRLALRSVDGKEVVARFPPDHQVGMRVPKGGSSCASCRFVQLQENECREPNFVEWNKGPKLPAPSDSYCSDFWQPAEGASAAAPAPPRS
jgi:hypothetical protein